MDAVLQFANAMLADLGHFAMRVGEFLMVALIYAVGALIVLAMIFSPNKRKRRHKATRSRHGHSGHHSHAGHATGTHQRRRAAASAPKHAALPASPSPAPPKRRARAQRVPGIPSALLPKPGSPPENGQVATISYVDSNGELTDRMITLFRFEPIRQDGAINEVEVHAWCHMRDANRTFVLSRIRNLVYQGEPMPPIDWAWRVGALKDPPSPRLIAASANIHSDRLPEPPHG